MPDSFIRVPPDSTGPRIRTYRRGSSVDDAHDTYVIPVVDRIISNTGLLSTFRMVGRGNTSRPLFTITNAVGSTVLVAVRRLVIQTDHTAARTAVMMQYKTYRCATSAVSGGTTLTKGQFDASETASASVIVRGDSSTDGTNSGTALAVSAVGTLMWQQMSHRLHTLAGESLAVDNPLLPTLADSTPVILAAGQGLVVRMETPTLDASSDHYWLNVVWEEFQRP
jgi:hypothetical protein